MRYVLFISMFFLLCKSVSAQPEFYVAGSLNSWAPIGAKWHTGIIESFFAVNQGYIETVAKHDTLILNKTCVLMESRKFNSHGVLTHTDTAYMYIDTGAVFHYRDGQFYTLYDFDAIPGDSWDVSVPYPSPFYAISFNPPDTVVTIVVDSVTTFVINGQVRKALYVHSVLNDWYFINPIVEGIGSHGGLYPYLYDWMDSDIPYLRCYEDSVIQYQTTWSGVDCDSVLTAIGEPVEINSNSVQVYPNPGTDYIVLKSGQFSEIREVQLFDKLFNLSLTFFNHGDEKEVRLDVSGLSPGVYSAIVKDSKGYRMVKKVLIVR